jgi:hypothetical protein
MVALSKRKFVILTIACVFMLSWGCVKKTTVPAPLPEPVADAPVETPPMAIPPPDPSPREYKPVLPPPPAATVPGSLELGDRSFQTGDYGQAVVALEAFLNSHPESEDRDRVLFQLGASYALADNSSRNPRQAENIFRQLIAEYPESRYWPHAVLILDLHGRIENLQSDVKARDEKIRQLSDELRILKEIDLQRRPSRPDE